MARWIWILKIKNSKIPKNLNLSSRLTVFGFHPIFTYIPFYLAPIQNVHSCNVYRFQWKINGVSPKLLPENSDRNSVFTLLMVPWFFCMYLVLTKVPWQYYVHEYPCNCAIFEHVSTLYLNRDSKVCNYIVLTYICSISVHDEKLDWIHFPRSFFDPSFRLR